MRTSPNLARVRATFSLRGSLRKPILAKEEELDEVVFELNDDEDDDEEVDSFDLTQEKMI